MFRKLALYLSPVCMFILISWGATGHRTVADVAYAHLTPQAKTAVNDILGSENIADISTWADDVRSQPEFRSTAPEHFLNLPLGLSRAAFYKAVIHMEKPNVYDALLLNMERLQTTPTKEQKLRALKFLVHFVGDIHQPLHVARAEDKGGNTLQVRYDGKGTNLHTLWDSKLIETEGLSDAQLASQIDVATAAEIKQWQKDLPIDWAWESYQLSSQLYADEAKPGGNNITNEYYEKYKPVVNKRLLQAGIRLAGLLNMVFQDGAITNFKSPTPSPTQTQSNSHGGYCDKVFGSKYFSNSGMTLLNLGAEYPDQTMTVVIYEKDRSKWSVAPETLYNGKKICVTGYKIMYNGKPEIVVESPDDITIQ